MQMKAKGMFISDKIDMLVSYLIMNPLSNAWATYAPESIKVTSSAATCEAELCKCPAPFSLQVRFSSLCSRPLQAACPCCSQTADSDVQRDPP